MCLSSAQYFHFGTWECCMVWWHTHARTRTSYWNCQYHSLASQTFIHTMYYVYCSSYRRDYYHDYKKYKWRSNRIEKEKKNNSSLRNNSCNALTQTNSFFRETNFSLLSFWLAISTSYYIIIFLEAVHVYFWLFGSFFLSSRSVVVCRDTSMLLVVTTSVNVWRTWLNLLVCMCDVVFFLSRCPCCCCCC